MRTHLRHLYEFLGGFSTATQNAICQDFLRKIGGTEPTIAEWLVEAIADNSSFENIAQPFVSTKASSTRLPTSADSSKTRIIHLLSSKGEIAVNGGPADYRFSYAGREVGPLRIEGANQRTSGAGGIDYIANTQQRPVLGEVKVDSDKNPFYAFIQLIVYLSELATQNQIMRANQHKEFGLSLASPQPFDLHILLADFNDRGQKGKLIEPTGQLARQFKDRLNAQHSETAAFIGHILCLRMDSKSFAEKPEASLQCIWSA